MPRHAIERRPWSTWTMRWGQLSRGAGLEPAEPVLLALSGGADSVLLLHLLAAAADRPRILAVHVDHGLRGAESDADVDFCRRLCASLDVPFRTTQAPLDPHAASLEERARDARYGALVDAACEEGFGTILTGHHADDALETLLMRWLRGSELGGLRGIPRTTERRGPGARRLRVVRPLLGLRREEVRCLLRDSGLEWREDSSNRDLRFQRNRIRRELVPWLVEVGGPTAESNLSEFAAAIEALEDHCARATAGLAWSAPAYTPAARRGGPTALGGELPRGALARLASPLKRRALWRLLLEGSGRAPGRVLLTKIVGDLEAGRCTRHSLPGAWTLQLRSDVLVLIPPRDGASSWTAGAGAEREPWLPFPEDREPAPGAPLGLPGELALPDGRRLSAAIVLKSEGAPVPTEPTTVELDAEDLPGRLWVRWSLPGDRFHPLGAPGSRPLRRFLADAGVPREERDRVPLVFAGSELVWAAGVRPCEPRRVRGSTRRRLRLELRDPDLRSA